MQIDFGSKMKIMGNYFQLIYIYTSRIELIRDFFFFFRIFTAEEIEEIRQITLWDIIVNSTGIKPDEIQKKAFFWNEGDPCPQPYQLNVSLLPPCKYLKGYDYFEV